MATISCKAAVAWSVDNICMETVNVSPPKSDEVRIKMESTSPCHTDLIALEGKSFGKFGPWFPIVLGHEGAGTVESIGDKVSSVNVGDHVVLTTIPQCRECVLCENPNNNLCVKEGLGQPDTMMPDNTSRIYCKGQPLHIFGYCGTWSEYVVSPEYCVCKINPEMPLKLGSLLGCAFATGFGSVVNAAKVPEGSACAVWGLGGVGLSALIGLQKVKAGKIIVIDINDKKFELAKQLGATDFVNPLIEKDVVASVQNLTNGLGCDYCFEFVGKQETIQQAINASHPGCGKAFLIGVLPNNEQIQIDPMALLPGRSIHSTRLGGYKMRDTVPKLCDEVVKGSLRNLEALISHNMDFRDIRKSIEVLRGGGIRVSLSFNAL